MQYTTQFQYITANPGAYAPNGVSPVGDASPSIRNTSSLSWDCGAMYALMTSSVTLPLLRQK
jgi:hypothetical protein